MSQSIQLIAPNPRYSSVIWLRVAPTPSNIPPSSEIVKPTYFAEKVTSYNSDYTKPERKTWVTGKEKMRRVKKLNKLQLYFRF